MGRHVRLVRCFRPRLCARMRPLPGDGRASGCRRCGRRLVSGRWGRAGGGGAAHVLHFEGVEQSEGSVLGAVSGLAHGRLALIGSSMDVSGAEWSGVYWRRAGHL